MKKPILIVMVAMASAVATLPACAQPNYLADHIERQRWRRLRQRQFEAWKRGGKSRTVKTRSRTTPMRKTPQRSVVERHPQVQVNGQMLQSAVVPIQRGTHTFVPMRSIFEALGATVTYDSKKRIVTAERNGSGMQLRLEGGRRSDMKGSRVRLDDDESPFVRNGVTMVPLRLVSEKMGAQVTYIPRPTTPLISITSKS